MIYFVQGEITRKIKIGYTKWWACRRIDQLSVGSPDELVLLGVCLGDKEHEKFLHKKFSNYLSHRREWFHESKEILDFIDKNCNKSDFDIFTVRSDVTTGEISKKRAMKMTPQEIEEYARKNSIWMMEL